MKRRQGGYTLTEVVVCAVVFGMVVSVGTDALAQALRTTAAGETRAGAMDQCSSFMYRISDELENTTDVLYPPFPQLMQGSSTIVLQQANGEIIGYQLVPDPHPSRSVVPDSVIERQLYEPGFPATQVVVPRSIRYVTTMPSQVRFNQAPGNNGLGIGQGQAKGTIQVELTITPPGVAPVSVGTKKTPLVTLLGL